MLDTLGCLSLYGLEIAAVLLAIRDDVCKNNFVLPLPVS